MQKITIRKAGTYAITNAETNPPPKCWTEVPGEPKIIRLEEGATFEFDLTRHRLVCLEDLSTTRRLMT